MQLTKEDLFRSELARWLKTAPQPMAAPAPLSLGANQGEVWTLGIMKPGNLVSFAGDNILEDSGVAASSVGGGGGGTGGGTPAAPANSIQFNNAGAFGGDAGLMWDNSSKTLNIQGSGLNVQGVANISGQVTCGGVLMVGAPTVDALLEIHNQNANNLKLYVHSDVNYKAPSIVFFRSRGTQTSPTPPAGGDFTGYLSWLSYDGAQYNFGAQIQGQASNAWTPTAHGTCLEFFCTLPNQNAMIEVARFANTAGHIAFEVPTGVTAGNALGFMGGGNTPVDTAFSKLAVNSMALGNGTQGDHTGTLTLQNVTLSAPNGRGILSFQRDDGSQLFTLYHYATGPVLSFNDNTVGQDIWATYNGDSFFYRGIMVGQMQAGTVNNSSFITITAGGVLNWNTGVALSNVIDVGISRLAAGSLAVGNGTQGNKTGQLTLGSLIEATSLSPTSAATAGVTGQIAWDASNFYVCTSGGAAGAATWKKAALTTV